LKEVSAEAFRTTHRNMLHTLKNGREFDEDSGSKIDIEIMKNFFESETSSLILDGGCGTGRSSIGLAKMGHKVICIDAIPEAIRLSKLFYREADTRADFVIGDILYLPFVNETFDGVFSGGVLEHFLNVDNPLKEYVRVLKKDNGLLAASVPNIFGGFALFNHILNPRRFLYWLDKEKRLIHREKLFTLNETNETFERNGLHVVKILPFRLDMILPQHMPSRFHKWIRKNQLIYKLFCNLFKIFPRFCIGFSWFFVFAKSSVDSNLTILHDRSQNA
jgi:SAM-dependent methyltransferase